MKRLLIASRSGLVVALLGALLVQHAAAQGRRYGTSGDFQNGILISLNDGGDKLLMPDEGTPLPFLYIPTDGGTVLRLDAETGDVLGEYPTAPVKLIRNPQRIAVDLLGNAWVLNWNEVDGSCGSETEATLVRIGVVIGGTRTDANGDPDPNGEYLKPPFVYSTCVDRDNDGLIRTSRGAGDILPWSNPNNEDTCGGISTCEDETILNFERVQMRSTPGGLAIDANNDLWVGGRGYFLARGLQPSRHQKYSGILGIPIPGDFFEESCGGDDAIVAGNGKLWSVRNQEQTGLLTYDPVDEETDCGSIFASDTIAIDPTTDHIWYSEPGADRLVELDEDGNFLANLDIGGDAIDITIDGFGNIWCSYLRGDNVTLVQRWIPDPNNPGEYLLHWEFELGATVISIDTNGKIWIGDETTGELIRIDPNAGPTPLAGLPPRGDVDLTIDLPNAQTSSGTGDATGFTVLAATVDEGKWIVVHDSEQKGTPWGTVYWDSILPRGTFLEVSVRASDDEARLADELFQVVEDGVSFNNIRGRYVEIQVRFVRTDEALGESPVLEVLEIQPAECHLLVADGPGHDTFRLGDNSHEFATRLGNIFRSWPVLMESIPTIRIHLPQPEGVTAGSTPVGVEGGEKPYRTFFVQVVMHNPRVFPQNPEQSTPGLKVSIWPDGRVTTQKFGLADGEMDLEIEVVQSGDDFVKLRVPFTVGRVP